MRHWLLLVLAAFPTHADVTLQYRVDSAPAANLPPSIDPSPDIRMKGAKGLTRIGRLRAILDFAKRELTLVDDERKRFATFPASEYGAKVAASRGAPAATPELPKMDIKTRKTGVTAKLLGIDTEQTEASLAIDLGQVGMSIALRIWTPKAAEVLRVPALREAAAATLWFDHILKVTDEFDLPGIDGLPLRLEMEVRATGAAIPHVDTSQPIFQMKMEATELSTAALDDALFRVPEDYTAAAPEELLKPEVAAPADESVQAFVPGLDPIEAKHPDYPKEAGGVVGIVRLLVTVGADGGVIEAEPIAGPEALRKFAVAEVQAYKYRPVLRAGKPVVAMTDHTVFFLPRGSNAMPLPDAAEQLAASRRVLDQEKQFPRTPQQVLADLENDAGDPPRTFRATDLAKAALDAGDLTKAETYANQALAENPDANDSWNRGNRIHYGHIVLGRVALRRGDVPHARAHLLAAGKTPGSPQLNSFGPDLTLARELLEKNETAVVLDYLEECRAFWKMGGARLDQWTRELRAGKKPAF